VHQIPMNSLRHEKMRSEFAKVGLGPLEYSRCNLINRSMTPIPDSEGREKQSAALTSLFAAVGLTAFKIVVGVLTGSLGILAEAAHSGLDLVAADC